jgi:hypothetical protein
MKTLKAIGVILVMFLFVGCEKSTTHWTSSSNNDSFLIKVVDADTNLPIQGATVYCLDSGWFLADTVVNALTDSLGSVGSIPSRVDYIKVVNPGHLTAEIKYSRPNPIELRKTAFAYFHIKNDTIALSSDYITITYYANDYFHYMPSNINLYGFQDTTIFIGLDPRQNIEWKHNNVPQYLFEPINIAGGDTTTVNFFY